VVLSVALYGCETSSLPSREEHGVLRKVFAPKRGEVTGWRKLRNKELHDVCYSPDVNRVIRSRRMIGWECGIYWGVGKCVCFWCGSLKDINHLEDLCVGGRIYESSRNRMVLHGLD
jgi:hypothetical protein